MNKNRNQIVLDSFVEYCKQHPNERFWQCLRNWCGANYIFTSSGYDIDKNEVIGADDTFYWEEKDK